MLDPDHLLAIAPVPVQRLEQRGIGPRQLGGGVEVHLPALDGLVGQHGPTLAFHARGVAGDHLAGQHALQLVPGLGSDQGGAGGQELPIALLVVRLREPQRVQCLIGQSLVEVVAGRAAEVPELRFGVAREPDLHGARQRLIGPDISSSRIALAQTRSWSESAPRGPCVDGLGGGPSRPRAPAGRRRSAPAGSRPRPRRPGTRARSAPTPGRVAKPRCPKPAPTQPSSSPRWGSLA